MRPSQVKKLSPPKAKKKKKVAVKADYGGVFFAAEEPATSRDDGENAEPVDDPMASYRAAAAAASKALEKERKEEASVSLYRKIFGAMDINGDGKVELAEMVEKIASGTAQLSHRATSNARPEGAVALQLPVTFGIDEWLKEMKRVSSQMDEPTFEANVLGLFSCFDTSGQESERPAADAPKLDRTPLLRELFDTMDTSKSGSIDLDDFLTQARTNDEAHELKTLFHFLDTTYGSNHSINFDAFTHGVLEKTPLGRMRDKHFASAIRGMVADVEKAIGAKRRLGLLKQLFNAMDLDKKGVVGMDDFLKQAKSAAERDELKESFGDFDAAGATDGMPEGKLTFRKFAVGTMQTPLHRLKDDQFETAIHEMISNVQEAKGAPTADVS